MVEFVPLLVPWERWLQNLAVLFWLSCYLLLGLTSLGVFVGLLFTRFWLLTVLYAFWWFLDRDTPWQGSGHRESYRRFVVWNYIRDYFPISLIKTAELDPSRNYIASFHPHGILGVGTLVNLCTESTGFSSLFPGIKTHLMTMNILFHFPVFRDCILALGAVSTDKESAAHILTRKGNGNLLAIVVGGAKEALEARPGSYRLILKKRKGFIRLALTHGAALVPAFCFGENDLFHQVQNSSGSWLRRVQNWLQKIMGISLPLFYGRGIFWYSFGWMPHRHPVTTIVGKPIEVQKTLQPTEEEVNRLHQHYMEELCSLFEAHKLKFNIPAEQHLEFC
nr:2-acylglycerol O-acyltransferase 2-like [Cavia porcellus]